MNVLLKPGMNPTMHVQWPHVYKIQNILHLVVKYIGELREEQRNRFKVNYGRHVTELAKIRDQALKHRSFSAAANAEHMRGKAGGLYVEQKHILHGKLDDDKMKHEMNKEIAELLKSNRKIINITPEDVIDVESTR